MKTHYDVVPSPTVAYKTQHKHYMVTRVRKQGVYVFSFGRVRKLLRFYTSKTTAFLMRVPGINAKRNGSEA